MKQIAAPVMAVDATQPPDGRPGRTAEEHLSRYLGGDDALETEAATGVGAGRFRTYIGKPQGSDAYFRKLARRRWHQGRTSGGKWSPPARRGDRPVDRVAAFRRYHALGP
jgi:hypothetical protein